MIGLEERTLEETSTPTPGRSPIGRIITGLLVIVIGAAWFLDLATDVEIRWGAILPIALIAIGVGVMYGADRQDVSGLIVIGIIISVIVVTAGFFTAAPWDGVGEVLERPPTVDALEAQYAHGVGDFTVDLRSIEIEEGTTKVEVSLGIGNLLVRVPGDTTVVVDANAGIGKVTVFDEVREGVGPSLEDTVAGNDGRTLELKVGVGMGEVEVTR